MLNDTSLYFVFNGRKSSDFGVWCSGDGQYDAPARDVEYVAVPGRNGDLAVDNGRWLNNEITYKDCFIPSNFRERYADLVSWLSSQRGYCRLEDSRHPEVYRMARFDAEIVPTMVYPDGSGNFDITFNCKPQRFLKLGEESMYLACSPAEDAASARRYWQLSAFSDYSKTLIRSHLNYAGYTAAEISAMQFDIVELSEEALAWLFAYGDNDGLLKFVGSDTDRFFAFIWTDDPTTATGQGEITTYEAVTSMSAWTFRADMGVDHKYIVFKKALGTEIYFDGHKIAQDDTYQTFTIVNPTRFSALPKFRITLPSDMTGLSGFTVYLGGVGQSGVALAWTDDLEGYVNSTVTIDTELMDVYILPEDNTWDGVFLNLNPYAKFFGERIELDPGENTIRLDPMVAACEIVPRWWSL